MPDERDEAAREAHAIAEGWCAMNLPIEWYEDPHGDGQEARCCRVVRSLETEIRRALRQRDEDLARLRERETYWQELWAMMCKQTQAWAGWIASRGITKFASDEDLKRAEELRKQLGLEAEK